MNTYTDYMLEQTTKILAIDSPSGFTSGIRTSDDQQGRHPCLCKRRPHRK